MNYEDIKNKYFNKKFIILYIVVFIILYIFCSFIKFLGQIPILILLTFFIVYYINNNMSNYFGSYNLDNNNDLLNAS
jgi:c-di-AMP phosphodiesterase-like protein